MFRNVSLPSLAFIVIGCGSGSTASTTSTTTPATTETATATATATASPAAEKTLGPMTLKNMRSFCVMVLPKGLFGDPPPGERERAKCGSRDTVCSIELVGEDGTETTMDGSGQLCEGGARDATALIGGRVMLTTVHGRVQDESCEGDPTCYGDKSAVNREGDLVKTIVAAP